MKYLFREIGVVITVLLLTSMGYIYGDYDPSSFCEENNKCFSCQPIPCQKGFISADLLYWRAYESGLDTCIPSTVCEEVDSDGKITSRFSGRGRDPHFRWNPGFRIGAGYGLTGTSWDLAAFWTDFHSHAHDSRNNGHRLRWNINLDVIDLTAGYRSNLSSCFSWRPFFGLRGARIDQKLHKGLSPCSACSSIAYDLSTTYTKNKQKFSGIGPLIGLEGNVNVLCGFSFYASASISWLYGDFHILQREYFQSRNVIDSCHVRKHLDVSLLVGDATLGIRWEKCICKSMRLILQLCVEHHRYFEYNRLADCCDLSFDGVNFSASVAF